MLESLLIRLENARKYSAVWDICVTILDLDSSFIKYLKELVDPVMLRSENDINIFNIIPQITIYAEMQTLLMFADTYVNINWDELDQLLNPQIDEYALNIFRQHRATRMLHNFNRGSGQLNIDHIGDLKIDRYNLEILIIAANNAYHREVANYSAVFTLLICFVDNLFQDYSFEYFEKELTGNYPGMTLPLLKRIYRRFLHHKKSSAPLLREIWMQVYPDFKEYIEKF